MSSHTHNVANSFYVPMNDCTQCNAEIYQSISDWMCPPHSHSPDVAARGTTHECSWTSQSLQCASAPACHPLFYSKIHQFVPKAVCSWESLSSTYLTLKPQYVHFKSLPAVLNQEPNSQTVSFHLSKLTTINSLWVSSITIDPVCHLSIFSLQ